MDRAKFFDGIRHGPFTGLAASQVAGMEAVLDEAEHRKTPLDHLAYSLATGFHETAATMQPIHELGGRSYFDKYEPGTRIGRMLGNTRPGDGFRYRGRGFVQLTGRTNYARAADKLHIDCLNNPDLVLMLPNAVEILFTGMEEGWFTGKSLGDFLDGVDEADAEDLREFTRARFIINGTDRAEQIGREALAFEHALRSAGYA